MAGGQNIRFEETLNMRDEAGAKPYIKYVYLLVVFLIVNAVVGGTLVAWSAMDWFAPIGVVDLTVSIMTGLWSERPFMFVGIVLVGINSEAWVMLAHCCGRYRKNGVRRSF